jgi:hypothetical protein
MNIVVDTDVWVAGVRGSGMIIRLPEEKRTRLKLVAKSRKVSVTKLIEEMATILLADFDAETRFELRAARGRRRVAHGLALLDKAAGKRARSKHDRRRSNGTTNVITGMEPRSVLFARG